RGRRHRHLEWARRMLMQEARLVLGQAVFLAELLGNHAGLGRRPQRRRVAPPRVEDGDRGFTRRVAVDRLDEIARPATAAVLAVAEDVDADLLLQFEHAQDRRILERAQVLGGETTFAVRRVRLLDLGWPQKTA